MNWFVNLLESTACKVHAVLCIRSGSLSLVDRLSLRRTLCKLGLRFLQYQKMNIVYVLRSNEISHLQGAVAILTPVISARAANSNNTTAWPWSSFERSPPANACLEKTLKCTFRFNKNVSEADIYLLWHVIMAIRWSR